MNILIDRLKEFFHDDPVAFAGLSLLFSGFFGIVLGIAWFLMSILPLWGVVIGVSVLLIVGGCLVLEQIGFL